MYLTDLDRIFWVAGLVENLTLLSVVWHRKQVKQFPFFSALAGLSVLRTIVLFFVHRYGSSDSYFSTYWSLAALDTLLQFGIVYEVASCVFKPLDRWFRQARGTSLSLLSLSLAVALVLSWLAAPPAQTWMQTVHTKATLFAGALMSELFLAMMAFAVSAMIPWRTHAAKIAQGLGAYSLFCLLIDAGHTYFGVGREMPAFIVLSQARICAYLICVAYWVVTLWRQEVPSMQMTHQMRETMFALQARLDYHLDDLRARKR